jgi:tetratricopeptide (TPR) repeat protein
MTPPLPPDRRFASTVRVPEPSKVSVPLPKILVGLALMALRRLLRIPLVCGNRRVTTLLNGQQVFAMVLLFVVVAAAPVKSVAARSPGLSSPTQPQASKDQAQAETDIGQRDLKGGRPHEAQGHCEAAVKLDPGEKTAKECLDNAAAMFIDQDLNDADAKLLSGDKKGAIALASKWASGGAQPAQQDRARKIRKEARSNSPQDIFRTLTPDWLRQILITILILSALALLLLGARSLWRVWQSGKLNSTSKTIWRFIPLEELPAATAAQPGIATDTVLDALARVGHELGCKLWSPKLLLLRPTPPANYEPAIISDFLSDSLPSVELAPAPQDLCVEWKRHDVQLDQAVQNLQLRTAAGIDIGSVARLLQSIVRWFNTGAPVISGIAETKDKNVSIHLAARGGRTSSISITTSTGEAPGISPVELSAERAAFKFLFRMSHPELTNDQIDGFSALRQGAAQFAQYAETVPGVGEDAKKRTSSLAKAAFNLSFFRASIPRHDFGCSANASSLNITEEVRQSVLLAEGVAHALAGGEQEQILAIDCFHQLQDWPDSEKTRVLRNQAAYNEAIVWRELERPGECILHLTELLGERTPDTTPPQYNGEVLKKAAPRDLPDAIRFPARAARISAFAQYKLTDWETLPPSRAHMLIDDAEALVRELGAFRSNLLGHDQRVASYMYIETLRSIGHIELLRVITEHAADLYKHGRPTGLRICAELSAEGTTLLKAAICWMEECQQQAPACGLYYDLAQAYLLLRDFNRAQGHARHAVLDSDPKNEREYERAYYIAAESFFLQGDADDCKAQARKYAEGFKGMVTLEQFKALRAALGISETPPTAAEPKCAT